MKKYLTYSFVFLSSFFLISNDALAQETPLGTSVAGAQVGINTFAELITLFTSQIISALGALFLSAGVVAFFYGVVQYIWGLRQGDAAKAKVGNSFMIWGLVGLFTMFSVYGIIKLAQSIIPGLDSTTITIPRVNFGTGSSSRTSPAPGIVLTPPGYTCTQGPCRNAAGVAGTCNAAGTACVATSGGGGTGGGGGFFTCTPGAACDANTTCSPTGDYCVDNPVTGGGGSGSQPNGSSCSVTGNAGCSSGYCDVFADVCADAPSGGSGGGGGPSPTLVPYGGDCHYVGSSGCATGYCDQATETCDYEPQPYEG